MGDLLKNLAIDSQIGIDKHVEGMIDHPFRRVLDRHNPKIGSAAFYFAEDLFNTLDRHILDGRAEFLHAGHMGKVALGPRYATLWGASSDRDADMISR